VNERVRGSRTGEEGKENRHLGRIGQVAMANMSARPSQGQEHPSSAPWLSPGNGTLHEFISVAATPSKPRGGVTQSAGRVGASAVAPAPWASTKSRCRWLHLGKETITNLLNTRFKYKFELQTDGQFNKSYKITRPTSSQ
jgi:hypothetical protein